MADGDPAVSPAQPTTVITRTMGQARGAATKGGIGVAGMTALINWAWECHDKHSLIHPDAATQGVMAACLIMLLDEIRVWLARGSQNNRRASDGTST